MSPSRVHNISIIYSIYLNSGHFIACNTIVDVHSYSKHNNNKVQFCEIIVFSKQMCLKVLFFTCIQ